MNDLDTLKRLLSSHLEKGAAESADELIEATRSVGTTETDVAMMFAGFGLALSIVVSLKRIADALEPGAVEHKGTIR